MVVIKVGKVPNRSKRFECRVCKSVFIAERSEYELTTPFEYAHDGVANRCQCPICGYITFNGVDV